MRIATGPTSGTYFPVGGVVATAISNPPGSRECSRGGICGVPGLIAVAHSSPGSVANVENVAAGLVESAFCQNDIAHWAFTGQAGFEASGVTDPNEIVREDGMPLARWGDPDEIAGPLVFLVSKLSSFMTGQTLIVDGGMNAHFPHAGANPMREK